MRDSYGQVKSAVRYIVDQSKEEPGFVLYGSRATFATAEEVLSSSVTGQTSFEAAFDKMRRQLKTLHRHAKNLQATLKREAAAKLQAEAKAAREAAAKRLGISRCYKCNWPGKPGDSCPNCSTGDDVVALPSAPARSAGGGGVRFSSSRSVLSQRLPFPFDRAAAGLSHN